jgi:hypothetical protein
VLRGRGLLFAHGGSSDGRRLLGGEAVALARLGFAATDMMIRLLPFDLDGPRPPAVPMSRRRTRSVPVTWKNRIGMRYVGGGEGHRQAMAR